MRFILFLLLLFAPIAAATPRVIDGDGFNLKLLNSSDTEIFLQPKEQAAAHNWFAASFEGLPLYRTTWRVDMSEAGAQNKGDVSRWQGLRPVISYADPQKYEAYLWYYKDADGVWISSDPLLDGREREAGNGPLPNQNVVAPFLAPEFLNAGGQIWSPWRDIEESSADAATQSFRFSTVPKSPRATVAMRVPYLSSFEDEFAKRLGYRQLPGVHIDELGKTAGGRPLRVFRVGDPNSTMSPEEQQTMLIYARENATDHDASWLAFGALAALLRDDEAAYKMRANTTWLIIPLADPDGAANSDGQGLEGAFLPAPENQRIEPLLYARYFLERANAGHSIDLALGFGMLEGNDNPHHIVCASTTADSAQPIASFNSKLFPLLQKQSFLIDQNSPIADGGKHDRLGNWLAQYLFAYNGIYQVNSRVPGNTLALNDLMFLGETTVQTMSDYAWSAGLPTHNNSAKFNQTRLKKQRAYYAEKGLSPDTDRYIADLMTRGFLPPLPNL